MKSQTEIAVSTTIRAFAISTIGVSGWARSLLTVEKHQIFQG